MLTYHDDPKLKESAITRMREHREEDKLSRGNWMSSDGRGCAVGCLVAEATGYDPDTSYGGNSLLEAYEPLFGISADWARVEERVFERSSRAYSLTWPERFLEAIPVGIDLRDPPEYLSWESLERVAGVLCRLGDPGRRAVVAAVEAYGEEVLRYLGSPYVEIPVERGVREVAVTALVR